MKRRSTKIVMVLSVLVILAILVFIGRRYNDQPILKHALQGNELVQAIEREFEVPIDPLAERPGVFSENLLYWRGLKWNAGTEITICGVTDSTEQKRIIDFVESEVHKNALCDIELIFEDMASIRKQHSSTIRIRGSEFKRIRIRGVSKGWRELQAEQEAQQAVRGNRR
jgi:hypothetical protein